MPLTKQVFFKGKRLRFLAPLEMTVELALSKESNVRFPNVANSNCSLNYSDCYTMPSANMRLEYLRSLRVGDPHPKEN